MFLDELTPLAQELTTHPIAFFGGFFSGLFRLNLADDPVKGWLDQHVVNGSYSATSAAPFNGRSSGPQSISID